MNDEIPGSGGAREVPYCSGAWLSPDADTALLNTGPAAWAVDWCPRSRRTGAEGLHLEQYFVTASHDDPERRYHRPYTYQDNAPHYFYVWCAGALSGCAMLFQVPKREHAASPSSKSQSSWIADGYFAKVVHETQE